MISTCILINDCILQDFKSPVDVSIEDVKRVQEMLCEYIPKEAIDRKGNLYSGEPWVYYDQKLETHSVLFSQVLLLEKPAWLAWLGWDTAWFRALGSFLMTPSKQALMRVTWNLMWSYLVYKCDLALPISVMWECVCDVSLLWWLPNHGWFQDAAPGDCQILAGSRIMSATRQVTVVVATVSVTGVN
jgi:hypothetical protein